MRIHRPCGGGNARWVAAGDDADELTEAVFDIRQAGLDRAESLDRDLRLFVVARLLACRKGFHHIRVGQVCGLAGATGATLEAVEEFEQGAPIPLPDKPIIEIETEDVLQVPAQGSPVAAYGVDEAGVPPGTSPAPGPKKCSRICKYRPISSRSASG